MIKKFKLKFGSSPSKQPLEADTTPITVFVGPNHSGKSKILMEIENYCRYGTVNIADVILNDLQFKPVSDPEFEINLHTLSPNQNEHPTPGQIIFGKGNSRIPINRQDLLVALTQTDQKQQYCQWYVSFNTIRLDGKNRINLINQQPAGDLQKPSYNSLTVLFKDHTKRMEVRKIIYQAFKKYFVVDPTNLGKFRIRLSDVEPVDEIQELGIHPDAIKFHKGALEIEQSSDGIKAFTGIITTLIAGDFKVILIDEPEAFLHPSLATNLGKEMSNSVKSNSKNLFVSTHSANFLMGCIQSGVPLNIVRLTYSNNVPTARILPSEKVLKLMRHPLLRSIGVLNGLFYEYVVVTESDADRAFYQEINERLLSFNHKKGIPNCLFLNAQNKQTIHEIVKPLREMGIPCAAIVDIDVIKDGGTVWTSLLNSGFVPEVTVQATSTSRSQIKNRFVAKGVDFKRVGGIDVLDATDKEACNNLFDQLDEYGIFTVRNGELESWLKNLGVKSQHSPDWLIEVFEKLGEDPASANYVLPEDNDVWSFLEKIKAWFISSTRKGMPD